MIDAIAAHALDFDDVFLDSAIHPSTVILPAILRSSRNHPPDEIVAAFGAGLIAAQAVAARVGLGHYHKGWHGTGTIGAFAAAAAAGRLRKLDERQLATMFSIVASQSAGLKVNFGTMTKPAHAGFAAAAGVRAAHLAQAGFTAAADIFGPGGYAELYGTPDGREEPTDDAYRLRTDKVALKLYPCCYGTHRLIGIALDARSKLGNAFSDDSIRIRVTVPKAASMCCATIGRAPAWKRNSPRPTASRCHCWTGLPTLDHFTDAVATPAPISSLHGAHRRHSGPGAGQRWRHRIRHRHARCDRRRRRNARPLHAPRHSRLARGSTRRPLTSWPNSKASRQSSSAHLKSRSRSCDRRPTLPRCAPGCRRRHSQPGVATRPPPADDITAAPRAAHNLQGAETILTYQCR